MPEKNDNMNTCLSVLTALLYLFFDRKHLDQNKKGIPKDRQNRVFSDTVMWFCDLIHTQNHKNPNYTKTLTSTTISETPSKNSEHFTSLNVPTYFLKPVISVLLLKIKQQPILQKIRTRFAKEKTENTVTHLVTHFAETQALFKRKFYLSVKTLNLFESVLWHFKAQHYHKYTTKPVIFSMGFKAIINQTQTDTQPLKTITQIITAKNENWDKREKEFLNSENGQIQRLKRAGVKGDSKIISYNAHRGERYQSGDNYSYNYRQEQIKILNNIEINLQKALSKRTTR